jgi:hypothetical protein
MVHALHEAWRVLVPQGILIDLRPYSIDVPLEILYKEGNESAGLIDLSPGIVANRAADEAITSVVHEGTFKELKSEYFDFAYYWNSVEDLLVDWNEKWKDEAILPDEVVERAAILCKKYDFRARVRVQIRMKLAEFVKQ